MDLIQPQIIAPLIALILAKVVYVLRNIQSKKIKSEHIINKSTDLSIAVAAIVALAVAGLLVAGELSLAVINSFILVGVVWRLSKKEKLSHWFAVLVGLASGLIASISELESNWNWLSAQPTESESRFYLYIGIGLFLAAEVIIYKLKRKDWRKLPTARKIIRLINGTVVFPAALVALFSTLNLETTNDLFTQRVYIYATLLYVFASNLWAYLSTYKKSKKHLKEERKHFLKLKKKDKKRKKKSRKTKKAKKN